MVKFNGKKEITFDCINVLDFWLVGFALVKIKKYFRLSLVWGDNFYKVRVKDEIAHLDIIIAKTAN